MGINEDLTLDWLCDIYLERAESAFGESCSRRVARWEREGRRAMWKCGGSVRHMLHATCIPS